MKFIEAYVRSIMYNKVIQALMQIHIQGLSVVEMRGLGHATADPEARWEGDFEHVHKIEIICRDDGVDEIVKAITDAAHTGRPGDGKIAVSVIEHLVRISTGEKDEVAL